MPSQFCRTSDHVSFAVHRIAFSLVLSGNWYPGMQLTFATVSYAVSFVFTVAFSIDEISGQ